MTFARPSTLAALFTTLCIVHAVPMLAGAKGEVVLFLIGEADAAGETQRELENRLRSGGLSVLGADAIPTALGAETPDEEKKRILRVIADRSSKSKKKYHDGELAELRTLLDITDLEIEKLPDAGDSARDHFVLRTALAFDEGDIPQARQHARRALHYDLDVTPDEDTFPPDVAELIRKELELLTPAELSVSDIPPDATVLIDGRAVDLPAALAPGRHVVEVRASGHRTRRADVELRSADRRTVSIPLAFELAGPVTGAAVAVLDGEQMPAALVPYLVGDVVVVANTEQRAAVVQVRTRKTVRGRIGDGSWLLDTVRDAVRGSGGFLGEGAVEPGWRWSLNAGTGWVIRRQAIELGEGASFAAYDSNGPVGRIRGLARNRLSFGDVSLRGDVEVRGAFLGGVRVIEPFTREDFILHGGTSTTVRFAAGYSLLRWNRVEPYLGGVVAGETHAAKTGPDGTLDIGLTTSYARISAGARAAVSVPVPGHGAIYLGGDYYFAGLGAENDDVRLGDEMDIVREYRGWIGTDWHLGDWEAAAELGVGRLELTFGGNGNNTLYPQPFNARRTIDDYVFTARFGRRF